MRHNELRRTPSFFDQDFYETLFPQPLWVRYPLQMPQAMKCDLKETDDAYEMKADMPGVDKNDITVDFDTDSNLLTISYEHKDETEDKKEENVGYVIRERSYSKTSRRFVLPAGDRDNIHAKYDNGVLTVTVGKKGEPEKEANPVINIE